MTTLFTFNKKAWKMPPLDAVRRYGSPDKDGRLGIYYTMDLVPNSAGLFLSVGDHFGYREKHRWFLDSRMATRRDRKALQCEVAKFAVSKGQS